MNRGSIYNFGPQNGISSVGDKNNLIQHSNGSNVAASQPQDAPVEPAASWRFVLREDTAGSLTHARKTNARLEIYPPNASSQRLEWSVNVHVPQESDLLELAWYFNEQWYSSDPTRAKRMDAMLADLGRRMFDSVFADPEARRYWRDAMEPGHEISWTILGSPRFHDVPWELMLHDFQGHARELALRYPFARQITNPPAFSAASNVTSKKLCVLWFVARSGNDIIEPEAVAGPIREKLGSNAEVELVTDGRFATLKNLLWEHTRRPKYHLLHLDLHGEVASGRELLERAARSPKRWNVDDRTARGPVPETATEDAWLLFADDGRKDPASASEVARIISESRIPAVVLNACHSAAVPEPTASGSGRSSKTAPSALAARLVEAGGFAAVGFSQSLHLVAARRFFEAFYQTLVQSSDRGLLDQAILRGRHALQEKRTRANVQLSDWSLPVWYKSRDITLPTGRG